MTEQDRLNARLKNTEKALLGLASILFETQSPMIAEAVDIVMSDYAEANSTLGLVVNQNFINSDDLKG